MFINISWKIKSQLIILIKHGKTFNNKLYTYEIYLNKHHIWLENYFNVLNVLKAS